MSDKISTGGLKPTSSTKRHTSPTRLSPHSQQPHKMTEATPEDAAAQRAAEQARIRKAKREAKIRAGGTSRLNKITGLGGGFQRGMILTLSSQLRFARSRSLCLVRIGRINNADYHFQKIRPQPLLRPHHPQRPLPRRPPQSQVPAPNTQTLRRSTSRNTTTSQPPHLAPFLRRLPSIQMA